MPLSRQPSSRPAWALALCPALVFLLAVAAYAPTLTNGFPFDDERLIFQNRLIASLRNIPVLFTGSYCRRAVALKPDPTQAHRNLAQAYDALDRSPEAADTYEVLLRLRPNFPAVHRRPAELYARRLSDPSKAEVHRRQAEGIRR